MSALVHLFDSNGLQVNTEIENGQLVLWLRDAETTVSVTCSQATAGRIVNALTAPQAVVSEPYIGADPGIEVGATRHGGEK